MQTKLRFPQYFMVYKWFLFLCWHIKLECGVVVIWLSVKQDMLVLNPSPNLSLHVPLSSNLPACLNKIKRVAEIDLWVYYYSISSATLGFSYTFVPFILLRTVFVLLAAKSFFCILSWWCKRDVCSWSVGNRWPCLSPVVWKCKTSN